MKKINEEECLTEWQKLNTEFGEILKADNPKKKLADFKDRVLKSKFLNIRQSESLLAKIANALDGSYGNTKTAEHMSHSHPTPTKK